MTVESTANADPKLGTFYGVGVGPGLPGMTPAAAIQSLTECGIIYCPRADIAEKSVALKCLGGLKLSAEIREFSFKMDPDRNVVRNRYAELAGEIAKELKKGIDIGYLTLGDSLTYSTYGYTIAALLDELPGVPHRTFPGVTSFSAIAAQFNWPLGEGKERILILPCPDDMKNLRSEIESHDVVILMKIGKRLRGVLETLDSMKISENCVFARKLGFPDEVLCPDVSQLAPEASLGYLSTMLIRKTPREKRHL